MPLQMQLQHVEYVYHCYDPNDLKKHLTIYRVFFTASSPLQYNVTIYKDDACTFREIGKSPYVGTPTRPKADEILYKFWNQPIQEKAVTHG
jgi:hypothetical protein